MGTRTGRDDGMRDFAGADRGAARSIQGKGSTGGSISARLTKGYTQPRDPAGPNGAISGGSQPGPGAKAYSGKQTEGGASGAKSKPAADPHPPAERLNQPAEENPALKDWAAAKRAYEGRGFWDRALDFLGGPFYDENEPDFNDPRTYHGGTYHSSTDILGSAASLLGMAGGPIGAAVGKGLSLIDTDADVYHTEMDPDSPLAHALASQPGAVAGSNKANASRAEVERTGNVDREIAGRSLRAETRALADDESGGSTGGSGNVGDYSDVMLKDRRKPYSGLKQMLETML
jgi:hypothetical protein